MNIRWLALPVVLLCCQVVAAAQDSPQTSEETPLPQVDIEAQRAKLLAMEAQLYAFEDQFFGEYNKLNDIRAYEVHCGWDMQGHFRVHICRPEFVEWAERGDGNFWDRGSTGLGNNYYPGAVEFRVRDYQKRMVAMVSKHPELLKVLQDRAELAARYAELRKKFSWD